MQIVKLELAHFNFFCPVTGERILSEDCIYDAKSVKGYWFDSSIDEPTITNRKLAAEWKRYLKKNKESDLYTYELLEEFLAEYPEPYWIVFSLSDSGMGCGGTFSANLWIVIDLNVKN